MSISDDNLKVKVHEKNIELANLRSKQIDTMEEEELLFLLGYLQREIKELLDKKRNN